VATALAPEWASADVFPGLPEAAFFRPGAYKDWKFERHFYAQAFSASTILHLAHGPCMDGATCDVFVRKAYGEGAVKTVFLEPHETADALELLVNVPSRARGLVVSDLSLQRGEGERIAATLAALAADGWRIYWRDHHHKQWDGVDLDALRASCQLTLDTTGTECGATLVQKALLPDDAWAKELALVVRDHDLWLRQDPRSITLFHAIVEAGTQRWIRHLLNRKVILDKQMERWAQRDERRTHRLVRWGLGRAKIVEGARGKVGVVYGRVPTNEVLHALEERGAHLSVLIKPSGSFSLRSRKDVPVCHAIAQEFGGGGHPNASGGRLGLGGFGLLGLWMSRTSARPTKALVKRALQEVDAYLAATPSAAVRR
jgi:oligoribonuclease NrnB/cAMP/cGMP phosphodiesterase (DHH superfamily)